MERYVQRIIDLRHQLGMSQDALATSLQLLGLDISRAVISKVENGKRPLSSTEICYFALALGVDPNWLHDWEGFLAEIASTKKERC